MIHQLIFCEYEEYNSHMNLSYCFYQLNTILMKHWVPSDKFEKFQYINVARWYYFTIQMTINDRLRWIVRGEEYLRIFVIFVAMVWVVNLHQVLNSLLLYFCLLLLFSSRGKIQLFVCWWRKRKFEPNKSNFPKRMLFDFIVLIPYERKKCFGFFQKVYSEIGKRTKFCACEIWLKKSF